MGIDQQQLSRIISRCPANLAQRELGQAARISGITPAAISLLLVHLKRGLGNASLAADEPPLSPGKTPKVARSS
jgi:tRNA uridine 5-carboxymethylaminomethyl modification enzyme